MGLFDFFFSGGSSSSRRYGGMSEEYRAALRELRKQRSPWYRGVRAAVIIVGALAVALLILAFVVSDLRTEIVFKLDFCVIAIVAGGSLCLPWITELSREERRKAKGENIPKWHKWVAFAFFGLIGVTTIFWIVSVFTLGDAIQNLIDDADTLIDPKAFTPLRVSVILTIQVLLGSVIAVSTLRFGKKYLGLRIVMYVTLAYLDFWLSWVVGSITVNKLNNSEVTPIFQTIWWVIAVLSAVGLGAAAGIFGAQARRKEIELIIKGDTKNLTEGDVDLLDAQTTSSVYTDSPKPVDNTPAGKTPEEQLAKIKDLLDKGIITEEEYQRKRQDIIDKM